MLCDVIVGMNIFKRSRGRIAEQLHAQHNERRRARSARDAVLADPMTSVALRTFR